MIGNDVVDLALAKKESNWKRTGFLQKIFTVNELLLIEESANPEILIWNLWSRKEAAYKIFNRETGIRSFIPQQLECFYFNDQVGFVLCNGEIYHTSTFISGDLIHSIAVTDVAYFDCIIPLGLETTIIKRQGIPFVYCEQAKEWQIVSKSHHGRYEELVTIKNQQLLFKA